MKKEQFLLFENSPCVLRSMYIVSIARMAALIIHPITRREQR